MPTIEHTDGRFVAREGDTQLGYLAYRQQGDVVDAFSTFVDPAQRGGGVALELVQALVDWVRDEDARVRPSCWYVAKVMQADPGMKGLIAD